MALDIVPMPEAYYRRMRRRILGGFLADSRLSGIGGGGGRKVKVLSFSSISFPLRIFYYNISLSVAPCGGIILSCDPGGLSRLGVWPF